MSVVNLLCGVYFRKSWCCLYVHLYYVFHSFLDFIHPSSLPDPTASTIALAIAIATTMVIVVMLIVIKEPCSEPQGTWLDYLRDSTTLSSWRHVIDTLYTEHQQRQHILSTTYLLSKFIVIIPFPCQGSWVNGGFLKTLALCIWLFDYHTPIVCHTNSSDLFDITPLSFFSILFLYKRIPFQGSLANGGFLNQVQLIWTR